jgi:hypothetical protein
VLPFVVSKIRCISHRKRVTNCGTTYKLSLKKSFRHFQTGSQVANRYADLAEQQQPQLFA